MIAMSKIPAKENTASPLSEPTPELANLLLQLQDRFDRILSVPYDLIIGGSVLEKGKNAADIDVLVLLHSQINWSAMPLIYIEDQSVDYSVYDITLLAEKLARDAKMGTPFTATFLKNSVCHSPKSLLYQRALDLADTALAMPKPTINIPLIDHHISEICKRLKQAKSILEILPYTMAAYQLFEANYHVTIGEWRMSGKYFLRDLANRAPVLLSALTEGFSTATTGKPDDLVKFLQDWQHTILQSRTPVMPYSCAHAK